MESVTRARDLLSHRGPEGAGLWSATTAANDARIVLGHRRLCIIDVAERSAQPMLLSAEGRIRPALGETEIPARLALTFNGEIYNYLELRTELQALGHRFETTGDVEVLLLAYQQWGEGCLDRLNGMFAFAIWDADRNYLFCARDRFGEKPFHYVLDEERGIFAFASEVKALIGMGAVDADLDGRAVHRYFRFGEQGGVEQTIWSGVRRLLPAHAAIVRFVAGAPTIETKRYWSLPARDRQAVDATTVGEFRELFADSVRLRLRSDVPVGSSLSGGLDSSSVVCQVSRLGAAAGQLAFTARMDDPSLDEGRYARIVSDAAGLSGHSVVPTAEAFVSDFDRLVYHQEEPFPTTSIFASYVVQRLARDHDVTVLLDGQGADEYLAGYAHYPATVLVDMASTGRVASWARERQALLKRTGADPVPPRAAFYHWWHAKRNGNRALLVDSEQDISFLQPELAETYADERARTLPMTHGLVDARLRADLLDGHLQELLRYADRNAMSFGRETRLPFLDHRLVELVMTLPLDLSYRRGESKWILRQAMRGMVPDAILDRRDKVGFATPWKAWTSGSLGPVLRDRLRQAELELSAVVQPRKLELYSAAALGVMAIASIHAQFRCLTRSSVVIQ
jgi:asparagine synthase (glutamine-hydrolysing)